MPRPEGRPLRVHEMPKTFDIELRFVKEIPPKKTVRVYPTGAFWWKKNEMQVIDVKDVGPYRPSAMYVVPFEGLEIVQIYADQEENLFRGAMPVDTTFWNYIGSAMRIGTPAKAVLWSIEVRNTRKESLMLNADMRGLALTVVLS